MDLKRASRFKASDRLWQARTPKCCTSCTFRCLSHGMSTGKSLKTSGQKNYFLFASSRRWFKAKKQNKSPYRQSPTASKIQECTLNHNSNPYIIETIFPGSPWEEPGSSREPAWHASEEAPSPVPQLAPHNTRLQPGSPIKPTVFSTCGSNYLQFSGFDP